MGRPVVVLSNNDGCIIARSNEAKALGIGMGQPFYQIRPLIDRGLVTVFSANFALYGDLSRRVMATLRSLVPGIEVYSIDEAFFDLRGMAEPLDELGRSIGRTIRRNVGSASPRPRRWPRSPRSWPSSIPGSTDAATCTARRISRRC